MDAITAAISALLSLKNVNLAILNGSTFRWNSENKEV